jgi:hypothetical protein
LYSPFFRSRFAEEFLPSALNISTVFTKPQV